MLLTNTKILLYHQGFNNNLKRIKEINFSNMMCKSNKQSKISLYTTPSNKHKQHTLTTSMQQRHKSSFHRMKITNWLLWWWHPWVKLQIQTEMSNLHKVWIEIQHIICRWVRIETLKWELRLKWGKKLHQLSMIKSWFRRVT